MNPMVEKIVNASIEILKRGGIDGLSMRAIAKEVELRVSSLYNHVPRKKDIYHLISEYICQNISYPDAINDPRSYIIELNRSFRRELLKIKHSALIFCELVPNTPKHLELYHKNMEALSALGVDKARSFSCATIIKNYVMSSVWDEEYFRAISRSINPAEKGELFYRSQLAGINYDRNFMYGLEAILDGLLKDGS